MLTQTGALEGEEFARLMARLGPFETRPEIAVAVSGGADSMALAVLAQEWVMARGGALRAVTVDHALRPESRDEAVQVGRWLAARGIAHEILTWQGDKPKTGIQEAARTARYALLQEWCVQAGILHLMLAHHIEDQAETVLLRLARGSGVDGLSAMPSIAETPDLRLLRPLLSVPKARLKETLAARGQTWIEDPSNRNRAFARVRARDFLASGETIQPARLSQTAKVMARARSALELAAANLLARSVSLHPAGFALVDPGVLLSAADELQLRALSAICRAVGGGVYPPRQDRLERLSDEIASGMATGRRTFAGCVFSKWRGLLLVHREMRAVAPPIEIAAGERILWDGRFLISAGCRGMVGCLGPVGWREIRKNMGTRSVPPPVCPTLPAFFVDGRLRAVPHLGFHGRESAETTGFKAFYAPSRALSQDGHCLV